MKPFRSFSNVPIVNATPTKQEMAADLAEETCLRLKELKAAAKAAEESADAPLMESADQKECYTTLEALMKGPHRWVVVPVILEHFPELTMPPTEQEKQAVEEYQARQAQGELK